jgi:hypothetical protein
MGGACSTNGGEKKRIEDICGKSRKPEERDHWEEQDVGGWAILKWILDRMGWSGLD